MIDKCTKCKYVLYQNGALRGWYAGNGVVLPGVPVIGPRFAINVHNAIRFLRKHGWIGMPLNI